MTEAAVLHFPEPQPVQPVEPGHRFGLIDHPEYQRRWTMQSSVRAFVDLTNGVGVRFDEVLGGPHGWFDGWRSSDLGYCRRKAFYTRMKAPREPETAESLGKFLMGHMIEAIAVQAVQSDPRVEFVEAQRELVLPLGPTQGHSDGVVRILDSPSEPLALLECKSMNSNAFRGNKARYDLPKSWHRLQVGSYLMAYEAAGVDIREGRILYVSKDNWFTSEHTLTLTDRLRRDVEVEIEARNELWEAGVLPRRLPSKTKTYKRATKDHVKGDVVVIRNPKCGYCPFAEYCYSEEDS